MLFTVISVTGVQSKINLPQISLESTTNDLIGIIGSGIKFGYPPKELELSKYTQTLNQNHIANGERLFQVAAPSSPKPTALLIKKMPDDNSCLFHSIAATIQQSGIQSTTMHLRSIIASEILADPITYSKVILGRQPHEYLDWIIKPGSWGGAIEISIFARVFGVEICSVDVMSLRMDIFGQDNDGITERVYIVYSGIHYDAVVSSSLQSRFAKNDREIEAQVMNLARECKRKGLYTDLQKLKCGVCGIIVQGESGAQGHATISGHGSFQEAR